MALDKTDFVPIDRRRITDRIFHDLRRKIVSGEVSRGAKLPTEKELGEHYGVSGPTVREAIRGLSVIGLVEVRHGSGAYVKANGESLVAMSLGAVIQLESVGVSDVLGILGVLNAHAAARAVQHATEADLRLLRDAAEALGRKPGTADAAAGVRMFLHALARAAHNPLLEVMCGFLANIQTEFAVEVADGSAQAWEKILGGLQAIRMRFVESIERRDAGGAVALAAEFHAEASALVGSLPKAREVHLSDPQLGLLLSTIVDRLTKAS